jgi:hypothetical protein
MIPLPETVIVTTILIHISLKMEPPQHLFLFPQLSFQLLPPWTVLLFCNHTITDATLDAKFLEHHTKVSISMKESILATRHALERLIQGLPESAIKPRASITIQLDQLVAYDLLDWIRHWNISLRRKTLFKM